MTSHIRLVLTLLFLCLAAALPAWGKKEKSQAEPTAVPERRIMQVTGRLELVSSHPVTEFLINGSGGLWYVARADQHKLRNLWDRRLTVTVEGEGTVIDMKFAGGQSAGIHRSLSNITVIAIETSDGVMLSVPPQTDWREIFRQDGRNPRFLYIGNVQVTGAGLEGSDPVLKLVATGSYREWNIAREDEHKLIGLQDRTVAVGGVQTITEGRAADGSVINIHTLSNIVIIVVSEPEGNQ